jgi:ethanolamine utilization protein EutN
MRIAEVIGTVTLNRCLPSFDGSRLKLAIPLTLDNLRGEWADGETITVWDDLGAGIGSRIAMSEGGEAAQPFRPDYKPVDAYNAALLDAIDIEDD